MNEKRIVTISELNRFIKIKIEGEEKLQHIFVRGEISNYKHHTRGHLYFTLKDETSRVSAVMFAGNASCLSFVPENGMSVLIEGRVGVYEANGNYQLYIDSMEQDGIGALHIEFEKLKKKLETEGLFNSEFKKPIPKIPSRVGVITAPNGAAVKDIISTINRRFPPVEVIVLPSLVQGEGAKENIANQIKRADEMDLDVIICGRGGGSIEDLWAFNEEIVARAIFKCKTPIISAIGHEIDFTIADFVADLRAPTPTGAAEMAVPNITDISLQIDSYKIRLKENISGKLEYLTSKFNLIKNSFVLRNPLAMYEVKEQKLDNLIDVLNNNIKSRLDKSNHLYQIHLNKLELLNPLGILKKGYSVVEKNGKIISNIKDIKKNDLIDIRLHKGSISAKVEGISE